MKLYKPSLKRQYTYGMIDSQRGAWRRVGYNHLISGAIISDYGSCIISNKCEWNDCLMKNNQEILLDLADFALQEQPEDNLMVAISRHVLAIGKYYTDYIVLASRQL